MTVSTRNTSIETDTADTPNALARALDVLANIRKARDSLREHRARIPPLEAAHRESAAGRSEADAARVLALADGDAQGAKGAASDAKLLATAEEKHLAALEDARRIVAALRGRVEGLEAELQALLPEVETAVTEHQRAVREELQTELEKALAPLVAWAHRADRAASASGLRIEHKLHEIRVPSLTASSAMVGWGSAAGAPFGTVNDGVPLPEDLAEPSRVLAAVKGYRALAEADAPVKFETWGTHTGEATRKAIERRNAALAAERGIPWPPAADGLAA